MTQLTNGKVDTSQMASGESFCDICMHW